MLISRRGATNVVATMLIFGIMIASVGVLYSQIAPTLLGYERTSASVNQEFIFQSIADEVNELAASSPGSVSRIHIVSDQTTFNIEPSRNFTVQIFNGTNIEILKSVNIAEFQSTVNGSFQPTNGENFVNRIPNEDTFMNNNTGEPNFVIKSEFDYSEGRFSMYFRPNVDLRETLPNTWKLSIRIIQIDFIKAGTEPLIFPLRIDEWTLRLRSQQKDITSTSFQAGTGGVSISHNLDGVNGTNYSFPGISSGDTVNVEIITIPVLFGI